MFHFWFEFLELFLRAIEFSKKGKGLLFTNKHTFTHIEKRERKIAHTEVKNR